MKHIIAAISIIIASPVAAQDNCGLTGDVYAGLGGDGFVRHSTGVNGALLIEAWVNSSNGNWLVFATTKDGISCLLITGTNYVRSPAPNA